MAEEFDKAFDSATVTEGNPTVKPHSQDPSVPPPSLEKKKELIASTETFNDLLKDVQDLMEELPIKSREEYAGLRIEIRECTLEYVDDPSPLVLSQQMAKTQVFKDRLLEIKLDAETTFIALKRIYNNLLDAFIGISENKSADKRKGEASLRLSRFNLILAEAEAFANYCRSICENLESQRNTISRRITCNEHRIKIGELGAGMGQNISEKIDEKDPWNKV
jgi:hypothetical protein